MKTYRAYQAEIQRLQAKAEAARRRELKGVIAHIRELIIKHELTREDLGLVVDAPRGHPAKVKKTVGLARYRDPATGKTWTGRGKPPAWIAGARDRSAFEIGAAASAAPAKAPKRKTATKAAKKSARKRAVANKPAAKKTTVKKAAVKKAAAKAPARRAAKAAKATKATKAPAAAPAQAPADNTA